MLRFLLKTLLFFLTQSNSEALRLWQAIKGDYYVIQNVSFSSINLKSFSSRSLAIVMGFSWLQAKRCSFSGIWEVFFKV